MTIFEKLANIQTELKAPKNQHNSFGNYNYRSAEDILEAVKPICKKHGAVLTLSDKIMQTGDRYYIEAQATLFDFSAADAPSITVTAYAREEETKKGMDASQVTGSASSYARKYALNGLFDIDDTKDADTMDNRPAHASTTTEDVAAKCEVCGGTITPYTYEGKEISVRQQIVGTKKNMGKVMCHNCYVNSRQCR